MAGLLTGTVFMMLTAGGCAHSSSGFLGNTYLFSPYPKANAKVTELAKIRLKDTGPARAASAESEFSEPSLWPIDFAAKEVVSHFGWRGTRSGGPSRMHKGIDIKAPMNTPVRSVASGIVTEVGENSGYGKFIVIQHDGGYSTCYAHLNQVSTDLERYVERGEPIGLLGDTGNATTPHVHFEVRMDGKPVDPWLFLPAE
ncbi:MAG: M23 family metallopeptidase [Candidatus Hydrogenedentes bacterium]|nr:M23 family metallopeptidase [Candidatus Hydrogenedentota bacterium]